MKAISLWQPWATLVAIGAKHIETRSWTTNYRGPLAIASTAKTPRDAFYSALDTPAIKKALSEAGVTDLPHGVIVATCELYEVRTASSAKNGLVMESMSRDGNLDPVLAMGDFSDGRFAWFLRNIVRIEKPLPAKGRQGLWEFPWPTVLHSIDKAAGIERGPDGLPARLHL